MLIQELNFLCPACAHGVPLGGELTVCCESCGRAYPQSDGVFILGDAGNAEDYPDAVYAILADVEARHFWFSGRNHLILSALEETLGALTGRSVLDIGCGTGFVLAELEQAGMLTCGLDMHLAGLRQARQRLRGVLLRAASVPFDSQFDVALLCDVIEHVADDVAVLREARRAVKNGGVVVVTVPACPQLWSVVDEASGHKRRYTRRALLTAMEQAGLDAVVSRFFGILLLPLQFLQRWRWRTTAVANHERAMSVLCESLRTPRTPLNALLQVAMAADGTLSRFPWLVGSSLLAIGYRSGNGPFRSEKR